MANNSFPHDSFSSELAANDEYIKTFKYSGLTGVAQKGLAIVTCMDSRINPLSVMGMQSGDAKILRNAGDIHAHIQSEFGVDTRSLEFRTVKDQEAALATDVNRIRAFPFLSKGVVVGGAIYDVTTGKITPVDC